MNQNIKWFFLLSGTMTRGRYFLVGIILFGVKYTIDSFAAAAFGQPWSPLNYLIWPNQSMFVYELPVDDRHFAQVMLWIALPFIWIGVTLTLQRLRDAGLPLALIILFFIPLVNLLLILALCVIPTRIRDDQSTPESRMATQARQLHQKVVGNSNWGALWLAAFSSMALCVMMVFLSANILKSYGFGVFLAAPFIQGWLAAVLYGIQRSRSLSDCLQVATLSLVMTGVVVIIVAIEGTLCVLMAAPFALGLSTLGALAGHAVQSRPWTNNSTPAMILGLLIVMPALLAAESFADLQPAMREVRTEVIVNAAPEQVWRYVIEFPPLAEPTELLFRAGIAYPQRAEIRGRGVGAVRHCIFSTGAFVEPIEVWDEPNCLAFRVTEQPSPMEELSPFHIHPPHLDNFLVSHRGQFQLERLPDGRTRLVGTTWYTNRMWPASYWGLWADGIIHRIHCRVLNHVRDLAAETARGWEVVP